MPARPTRATGATSFHPPSEAATFRDLLFFEERLKINAAALNRRKRRYQLFLAQLTIIIAFLLSEVLLQTNFLAAPYRFVLTRLLPEVYTDDIPITVHPYFASGLLFVAVTTLVLFFASGMYSEKIGYANRYVPHANRALRNFNMYLNVRQPPLRSKIPFNPLSYLFPRPTSRPTSPPPVPRRPRSPSPMRPTKRSSSVPIPSIPPATNPRGELIFSSRVDRSFCEGYERYRTMYERRREERERAAYESTWLGWIHMRMPWVKRSPPAVAASGTATPVGGVVGQSPLRPGPGRATGSPSPVPSRRSTPVPPRGPRRVSNNKTGEQSSAGQQQQHPLASEMAG